MIDDHEGWLALAVMHLYYQSPIRKYHRRITVSRTNAVFEEGAAYMVETKLTDSVNGDDQTARFDTTMYLDRDHMLRETNQHIHEWWLAGYTTSRDGLGECPDPSYFMADGSWITYGSLPAIEKVRALPQQGNRRMLKLK